MRQPAARVNPFFESGVLPAPPVEQVRAFHRSLPGYAPTPLHVLPGLARDVGIDALYVKDEGRRFGLKAFKALGASWALHQVRARRSGAMTVSTATDGNHGRAVAWSARQLGLPAVIYIPDHAAAARVENIQKEGARVVLVRGTYDQAVQQCARDSAQEGWQVIADVGYEGYMEIPNLIVDGYATLYDEIEEELVASRLNRPDVVIVQAGVGSLLESAVRHFRGLSGNQPRLVAVEPVESDPLYASINTEDGRPAESTGRQDSIMAGLNCGQVSLAAWPTNRRGVELFVTIGDRFAEEAMRRLADPPWGDPPVVAGESGAAGFGGLLALLELPALEAAKAFLELGASSRVLVINTEGATDPEGYRRVVGRDPAAAP